MTNFSVLIIQMTNNIFYLAPSVLCLMTRIEVIEKIFNELW